MLVLYFVAGAVFFAGLFLTTIPSALAAALLVYLAGMNFLLLKKYKKLQHELQSHVDGVPKTVSELVAQQQAALTQELTKHLQQQQAAVLESVKRALEKMLVRAQEQSRTELEGYLLGLLEKKLSEKVEFLEVRLREQQRTERQALEQQIETRAELLAHLLEEFVLEQTQTLATTIEQTREHVVLLTNRVETLCTFLEQNPWVDSSELEKLRNELYAFAQELREDYKRLMEQVGFSKETQDLHNLLQIRQQVARGEFDVKDEPKGKSESVVRLVNTVRDVGTHREG